MTHSYVTSLIRTWHDLCIRVTWLIHMCDMTYSYLWHGLFLCDSRSCHSYVLQCVAVCCSVLQCVAVCCSVLQCVVLCCSVLYCAAYTLNPSSCLLRLNVLQCEVLLKQCVAVCCSVLQRSVLQRFAVCYRLLQRISACCRVLICVAVRGLAHYNV